MKLRSAGAPLCSCPLCALANKANGRPGWAKALLAMFVILALFSSGVEAARAAPVEEGTVETITADQFDISPDDRHLLFAIVGKIYQLPVKGGKARRIGAGEGFEISPVYSPNGRSIAYISDAAGGYPAIWLMARDGTGARKIAEIAGQTLEDIRWQDEAHLIATGRVGSPMYRVSVATGEAQKLDMLGQLAGAHRGYAVAGKQIFIQRRLADPLDKVFLRANRLLRFCLDKSCEPSDLGPAARLRPQLAADGTTLALLEEGDEGMSLRFIGDHPVTRPVKIAGRPDAFVLARDGRFAIIMVEGKLHRVDFTSGNISAIPARFELPEPPRWTPPPFDLDKEFDKARILDAASSPVSLEIIYVAYDKLWIKDGPGSAPRRLTSSVEEVELFPAFSPDGAKVAYAAWSDSRMGAIIIHDVRTGKSERLSLPSGRYISPRWAADGNGLIVTELRTPAGWLPREKALDEFTTFPIGLYRIDIPTGRVSRMALPGSDDITPGAMDGWIGKDGRVRTVRRPTGLTASAPHIDFYIPDAEIGDAPANEKAWQRDIILDQADARSILSSPDGRHLLVARNYDSWLISLEVANRRRIELREGIPGVLRLAGARPETLRWVDDRTVSYLDGDDLVRFDIERRTELGRIGLSHPVAHRAPAAPIALVNARIITMSARGVIEKGTILIRNGEIEAIGRSEEVPVPKDMPHLDLGGATVAPGLIETHGHSLMADGSCDPFGTGPMLLPTLAFGVTTFHELGVPEGLLCLERRAQRIRLGEELAPRYLYVGLVARAHMPVESDAAAADIAKQIRYWGATHFKSYLHYTRDERLRMVRAAREQGLRTTQEGGRSLWENVRLVAEGHSSFEHWSVFDQQIGQDIPSYFKKSGVIITPTPGYEVASLLRDDLKHFYAMPDQYCKTERFVAGYYMDFAHLAREALAKAQPVDRGEEMQRYFDNFRLLDAGGVRMSMGTHYMPGPAAIHMTLWELVRSGMPANVALRLVTIDAAEKLGVSEKLGSLEAGKKADLLVVDGDPLSNIEDLTRISRIMLDGRILDGKSLDQQWPSPEMLAKPVWQTKSAWEACKP